MICWFGHGCRLIVVLWPDWSWWILGTWKLRLQITECVTGTMVYTYQQVDENAWYK